MQKKAKKIAHGRTKKAERDEEKKEEWEYGEVDQMVILER